MKMKLPALLVAIAAISSPFAGAAPWGNVYTSGHADLGVAYEEDDGGLHFHYHFGTGAVINGTELVDDEEVDIGDATTYVSSDAKLLFNSFNDATYEMLGLGSSGGDLWVLPQNQNPSLPFLGLATEELESSDWDGGLTFTLDAVSGPGEFSMWYWGIFGDFNFAYSTNNPAGTLFSNTLTLPTGTHAHYNWGFTTPGLYEVTITVSGMHNDFGFLSDTQTITFGVETIPAVPEPATYGLAIGALLLGVVIARRRKCAFAAA